MVFLFLATCTTPGTPSQILSTIIISMRTAERTRMAQRSMSVGPNTLCLIIGILPGPTKYFRDAEGSSGLMTGGEQFCNYFLARAKPLTRVFIGIFLKKAISSALGTGVRRGAI